MSMATSKTASASRRNTSTSSNQAANTTTTDAAAAAVTPTVQPLPKKEAEMLNNVRKLYDKEQYKKAIKIIQDVVKAAPYHCEAHALHALLHHKLEAKKQAYEAIRKSLACAGSSSIAWQVYGIMLRDDRCYYEACEAYENAHKVDPNNMIVIRDLSQIQLHVRKCEESLASRKKYHSVIEKHASSCAQKMAIAVTHYISGNYEDAMTALEEFKVPKFYKKTFSRRQFSHFVLFQNKIIEAQNPKDPETVLAHLEKYYDYIIDKDVAEERMATYLIKCGRADQAKDLILNLMSRNFNSRTYAELAKNVISLKELANMYPRSYMITIMVLESTDPADPAFDAVARDFLESNLKRGVPSLFSLVKSLCRASPDRAARLEALVIDIYRSNRESSDEIQNVSLWGLYYLAKYNDFIGNYKKASIYLDVIPQPHPQEAVMLMARIYKHGGDLANAHKLMNDARLMDLGDRHVNCKCAKYALRNGKYEVAFDCLKLFFGPSIKNQEKELIELQYIWFLLEHSMMLQRKGTAGNRTSAIARLETNILGFLNEFNDDVFFFHSYCHNRPNIVAYTDLLAWVDDMFVKQKQFLITAERASYMLLAIYDFDCDKNHQSTFGPKLDSVLKIDGITDEEILSTMMEDVKISETSESSAKIALTLNTPISPLAGKPKGVADFSALDRAADIAFTFLSNVRDKMLSEAETASCIRIHRLAFQVYVRQYRWPLALRSYKKISRASADNVIETGTLYLALDFGTQMVTEFRRAIVAELGTSSLFSLEDVLPGDYLNKYIAALKENSCISSYTTVVQVTKLQAMQALAASAASEAPDELKEPRFVIAEDWATKIVGLATSSDIPAHVFGEAGGITLHMAIEILDKYLCEPLPAVAKNARNIIMSAIKTYFKTRFEAMDVILEISN